MRPASLRLRLMAAGAAALAVALLVLAMALTALFSAHVKRLAVAEMSVQLDHLIAGLARDPASGALTQTSAPGDPRFDLPLSGRYWTIQHPDGVPALRSRSLWDETLVLPDDLLSDGAEHVHDIPGPQHTRLLASERLVRLPDSLGGGAARLVVAMDSADLTAAVSAFRRGVAPYLAALALVLLAAGWAQVSVGLSPLHELTRRIADLRHGARQRLGDDIPVEIRPLGQQLDAMLDERDGELTRARQRAGDLAHGLKTPLQALLGEADRLQAAGQATAAQAIAEISATMQRHVDRELARTRRATQPGRHRADLATVAARVLRVVQRTPAGAACDWQVTVPPGLSVALDPDDLAEVLGALIENAARHARARITLTARREGSQIIAELCDDGPGIPADQRDRVMARGISADARGHGLGLAIADEIITEAGGSLALADASPGLRVTLHLPGAAPGLRP